MFTEQEQKAIEEKSEQLRKVKEKIISPEELIGLITKRRLDWTEKHLKEMLKKYKQLKPEEQAYRIIYFEHMKINPAHTEMIRISPTKIKIKSYNFCPYLEACKQLNLDTKFVCKEIGEPSIHEIIKKINPKLKFSRNYNNIRPHNEKGYCEEYIELTN